MSAAVQTKRIQELEKLNGAQEVKLQQAAQYVQYQQQQLQLAEKEIERLKTLVEKSPASSAAAAGGSSGLLAQYEQKLKQGEEYVKGLLDQLKVGESEIDRLQTANAQLLEMAKKASKLEGQIEAYESKLRQGSDYVALQRQQLEKAAEEIEKLKSRQIGDHNSADASLPRKVAELESLLAKSSQEVDRLKTELQQQQIKAASSSSSASNSINLKQVAAESEAAAKKLQQYELKLKQGEEFVKRQAEQLQLAEREIERLRSQNVALSESLATATVPAAAAPLVDEATLFELKNQLQLYEEKLEQAQELLQRQSAQLALAEKEMDRLRAENSRLASSHASQGSSPAPASNSEVKKELERLRTENARLASLITESASSSSAEGARVREDAAKAKARLSELEKQVVGLQQQAQQNEDYKAFQSEQLAIADAEIERLKAEAAKVAKQLQLVQQQQQQAAKGAAPASGKSSSGVSNGTNGANSLNNSNLATELSMARQQVQTLQMALDIATKDLESANQQLQQQQQQFLLQPQRRASAHDNDLELSQLREQVAFYETKMSEGADYVAQQALQLQELQTEVERLQEQLLLARPAPSPPGPPGPPGPPPSIENHLDGVTSLDDMTDDVDQLQLLVQEKESKLAQSAKFVEYQKQQVNELRALVFGADEQLQAKDQEITELQNKLAEVSDLNRQVDNQAVVNELIEVKMELVTVRAEHEQCEHTIFELKKKLAAVTNGGGNASGGGARLPSATAPAQAQARPTGGNAPRPMNNSNAPRGGPTPSARPPQAQAQKPQQAATAGARPPPAPARPPPPPPASQPPPPPLTKPPSLPSVSVPSAAGFMAMMASMNPNK